MDTNTANPSLDDTGMAKSPPKSPGAQTASAAIAAGERSFADAADIAKAQITETAHRAQRALQETLDTLRAQSRTYVDTAGQQIDVAQRYVTDRVKERPLTATMAGVGVGLLLGLLLAGRSHNRH